jgi:hypothetical protein
MLGASDRVIAELCMDEDRVLVTNNIGDFLALAREAGLHPGLVVMPLASREEERQWMALAIEGIEKEARVASRGPAALMVNRVVEVGVDGQCSNYDYP